MKFRSHEVALFLYKSTIRRHAWSTVVMPGLVLLVATCNCKIWYKNGFVRPFVLQLLPLQNPWLLIEMQPACIFSIGITLVKVHLNWLNWFHFLIVEEGLLVILIDCMIFLSPFLDVTRMSISTVYFVAQLDSEFSAYRMLSFDLLSKWL